MLLYHFTDADHWSAVLASAEIRPTWQRGGSPLTVHLSRDPRREVLPWALRERSVRIAVEVPAVDAHLWVPWSRPFLQPEELWSLTAPSSENQWNGEPGEWFIVERPVPMTEWLKAEDVTAGRLLWPLPDDSPGE